MNSAKQKTTPLSEEFAFDLTPDLTDGQCSTPHKRAVPTPQGSEAEKSREDDLPHNGRKGGSY